MNAATVIAVIALILIVFFAVRYIYKEKKRGVKCIGCPYGNNQLLIQLSSSGLSRN